jgi:glycosyltransferase involved in cell wall biosynthesis
VNIAYHSDAFANAARYGLGRYAWELLEAIAAQQQPFVFFPASSRFTLPDTARAQLPPGSRFVQLGRHHRAMVLSWALARMPRIEHWLPQADLVHTVELDYPVATARPWVVTVHDLGPLTHPEYFSRSRPWLRRLGLQRALQKAALIVAVSGATAQAIESLAGRTLGQRLRVIPEGVSGAFFTAAPVACLGGLDMPPAGTPYFLWTGSINPRKNLANVITAFEAVSGDCEHHLVLAGGLGWDADRELAIISRSPQAARIHRTGFVTDEQLRALYQNAAAFIYVSFMEGFGLPILEAMAGGCPVITSNLSSMPEVAGDAGMLVSPARVDEIADAMLKVAGDDAVREQLRIRGIEQARRFNWETTAQAMLQAYTDAAA